MPTAKPMRQPAIEKVFDIEVNSTATSIAPGTCSTEGGGLLVEIDLRIGEVGEQDDAVLLREGDEVAGRSRGTAT